MPNLGAGLGFTVQLAAGAVALGTGRLIPTAAAVVGLISVLVGGLSLARPAGTSGAGRRRAGAVTALVLGLTGTCLGSLALARSRRTRGTD